MSVFFLLLESCVLGQFLRRQDTRWTISIYAESPILRKWLLITREPAYSELQLQLLKFLRRLGLALRYAEEGKRYWGDRILPFSTLRRSAAMNAHR